MPMFIPINLSDYAFRNGRASHRTSRTGGIDQRHKGGERPVLARASKQMFGQRDHGGSRCRIILQAC